jgi:flagellar biosynthesis/type III secretory pathway protein FliH
MDQAMRDFYLVDLDLKKFAKLHNLDESDHKTIDSYERWRIECILENENHVRSLARGYAKGYAKVRAELYGEDYDESFAKGYAMGYAESAASWEASRPLEIALNFLRIKAPLENTASVIEIMRRFGFSDDVIQKAFELTRAERGE